LVDPGSGRQAVESAEVGVCGQPMLNAAHLKETPEDAVGWIAQTRELSGTVSPS